VSRHGMPLSELRFAVQNPKSESRNPKQIPNLKSECSKPGSQEFAGTCGVWDLKILVISLAFVSDFEIRISDLKLNGFHRGYSHRQSSLLASEFPGCL
jgi:hypothetical protein